ncbi:MAG: hypothetical protein B7Y99_05225 [Caulobacterales bacterium 32-69-10]|nr:MAG: hypothetical protein B7Y99_05225 [Caulobacterales bacterium 32-69-10]
MAMLERLAEIGMEIAEDAGRMSRSQAEGVAQAADPGLTYSRAARAVRLTIALQQRLTEGAIAASNGWLRPSVKTRTRPKTCRPAPGSD